MEIVEHKGNPNGELLCECLSSYVDEGSIESHRYYLSRKTVLEMLRDRGYVVPNSEIELSLQEFRAIHGRQPDIERLGITAVHRTDPTKRMLVIYCGPGMVKVNVIRSILMLIVNKESLTGLILILQNKITKQASKAVENLPFKVEFFQITDFLVNVTKHILKPKHQVLTDEEKKKLLEKYKIEEKQLPRMLQKDILARYYGLQRGQVVKLTYNTESTGLHVTYRCVW